MIDSQFSQQQWASRVNYLFVVDRSGSMGHPNTKFNALKHTLQMFIGQLPPNARYQVISYGQDFEWLGRRKLMLEHNLHNAEATKEEISKFTYSMGASIAFAPLEDIFSLDINQGQKQRIFLLTDGAIEQQMETIDLIKKGCRRSTDTRVFTVGIGDDADQFFIENAAVAGKGSSVYIRQNNLDKLK